MRETQSNAGFNSWEGIPRPCKASSQTGKPFYVEGPTDFLSGYVGTLVEKPVVGLCVFSVARRLLAESCGLTTSYTIMSGLNDHFLIASSPFLSWL